MATKTRRNPSAKAVPDWVPAVEGFWGEATKDGLGDSNWERRYQWMQSRLPDDATRRCAGAAIADGCLHLFESRWPNDIQPRNTTLVVRRFAFGLASDSERHATAYAANANATAYAAYAANAAYAATHAATAFARLNQARLLSLFTVPNWTITEAVRGLARGAVEAFFQGETMTPYLHRLADALQEAGDEYDYRIRAMQYWDGFTVGMYPLVPSVIGNLTGG